MLNKIVENFLSNKLLVLGDNKKTLNNEEINLIIKNISDKISSINENIIGIMLPRDINYILVILALWKLGKAFVPLNCNWPSSYVNLIIKRSNIKYLITDKNKLSPKKIKFIFLKNELNVNYRKKIKKNT